MGTLGRIRKAMREGRYVFTDHAVEEAQADHLWFEDVVHVLLHGRSIRFTRTIRAANVMSCAALSATEKLILCVVSGMMGHS